ncbi:hypothetical protein ACN27G_06115 [Plantactinospora sp. WMMB334]|uniref:hypothetical protein n=1 Tax=Plantactinospora sp. WMMB334 TaxID=3404119 RepID=UPI003B94B057
MSPDDPGQLLAERYGPVDDIAREQEVPARPPPVRPDTDRDRAQRRRDLEDALRHGPDGDQ